MWLDWRKGVQLYLARTRAMVQRTDGTVINCALPETMSLERKLQVIADAMAPRLTQGDKKERKALCLDVTLSVGLCPPIGLRLPEGITGYAELRAIAHALIAQEMQMDVAELEIAWNATNPTLACAIPLPLAREIRSWAEKQSFSLRSIKPLWSVATDSRLARKPSSESLTLIDIDALCLFGQDTDGHWSTGSQAVGGDATNHLAILNRMAMGRGFDPTKTARLRFGTQTATVHADAPKAWASHWELV